MEIVEWICKNLNYHDTHTKLIFVFLGITFLVEHGIYYVLHMQIEIPEFIVQIIMLVIMYISVYMAPKACARMFELEKAFVIKDYTAVYAKYVKEDVYVFRGSSKFIKKIFFWVWICVALMYSFCFYFCKIIVNNYIGFTTLILYVVAIVLDCFSYYMCYIYVLFLRKLSNSEMIEAYPHNEFLPSTSRGFQLLLSNAQINSMIFLVVSLLFSLSHCLLIIIANLRSDGKLFASHPYAIFFLSFVLILLGIGTFLIDYLGPLLFLRRILEKWKACKNAELETKLRECNFKLLGEKQRRIIIAYIKELNEEHVKYKYKMIDYVLIISTILSNLIVVLSFAFSKI